MTLQAEDALRRRVWEAAIGAFKRALEREPRNFRLRLGLGRSYEGRGGEKDGQPFLPLSVDQYRQAVEIDPASAEAHEALIAAAAKAGRLEEALADYKRRIAREPHNDTFRTSLKKIQALTLLTAQKPAAPRGKGRVVEIGLILAAVAAFLLAVGFEFQSNPAFRALSAVCVRAGLFILAMAALHRLWMKRD